MLMRHMMHDPCGAMKPNYVCVVSWKYIKHFPKVCRAATVVSGDEFPEYRRGNKLANRMQTKNLQELGDEWVIPYNPYLMRKYDTYINVEICNSIKSVKYLYKQVFKSQDKFGVNLIEDNNIAHVEVLSPGKMKK